MSTLLDAALRALDEGWNVLPVHQRKGPHPVLVETGHARENEEGRLVPSWRGLQDERVTEPLVREWFHPRWQVPGLAAVTGRISGRVVLDLDGEDGRALLGTWGLSASALSGSGSPHLYFAHPGWHVRTVASGSYRDPPFPGLDVRGDGGMIVLPPSVLANGTYRLCSPNLLTPEQLPEPVAYWTGLLRPPVPDLPEVDEFKVGPGEDATTLLSDALSRMDGGRNNAGYWLARQLKAAGYPKHEARGVMERYADHVPDTDARGRRDAYTRRHALASLDSAYRAPSRLKPARGQGVAVQDPLEQARRVLPGLSLDDRVKLGRLVAGAYARESEEAAANALRALGLDVSLARWASEQLGNCVSLPGKNKLVGFLRQHSL